LAHQINPVDRNVGKRLRQRRVELGMSQQALGEVLGLSFQQIQKYESGANRIAASRLYAICQSLEVEVSFFFEGVDEMLSGEDTETRESKLMTGREALELLRSYVSIRDSNIRKSVRAFLASVAQAQDNQDKDS
jgi:transcriptional regulator with XRE-family HTH domain